jgi:hypothetical protein
MALTTIIGIVAAVATVASTAYSVVSSEQAKSKASHERRKARNAAYVDEMEKRRRVIAKQASMYGASGLEMEGSPLLVQAESIFNSERNLQRTMDISNYYGQQEENQANAAIVRSVSQGTNTGLGIGKAYNWWS